MTGTAASSAWFWQAWTAVNVALAAYGGAHLGAQAAVAAPTRMASSGASEPRSLPIVTVEAATSAEPGDRTLARLAQAQTSAELCQLLSGLGAGDDDPTTFAITGILERAHLSSVRACSVDALTRQTTPAAQSWLIDLSQDPDPDVQRAALEALAARDDGSAQAVVAEAAHSDDADTRVSAVIALLEARRPEAFSAAKTLLASVADRDTLLSLIEALGQSGDARALPALTELIKHGERDSHLRAIYALGKLGQPAATPILQALLEVGSDDEYRAAADALAELAPEAALSKLRVSLGSDDQQRQVLALTLISNLNLPGVLPLLREQLHSGTSDLENVVLARLGRKPEPTLEGELIDFLGQSQGDQRQLTLRALLRLASPAALAAVERASTSEPPSGSVAGLLSDVPGQAEQVRARRIAELERVTNSRVLAELAGDTSEAAQRAVLRHLATTSPVPWQLQAVARAAPASTVRELITSAGTLSPDLRRALIRGLATRGDPQFSSLLGNAAHDDDPATRHSALQGLINLGDESARQMIAEMAKGRSPLDRNFAIEILGQRSDLASTSLLEGLASDPNANTASSALSALQVHSPELAARLTERAYRSVPAEDRGTILSAASGLKGSLARPLYDLALRDADDATAIDAVNSIAALEGPESAQRLLAVLADGGRSQDLRVAAANALHTLGGSLARSNQRLIDSLREPGEEGEFVCLPTP